MSGGSSSFYKDAMPNYIDMNRFLFLFVKHLVKQTLVMIFLCNICHNISNFDIGKNWKIVSFKLMQQFHFCVSKIVIGRLKGFFFAIFLYFYINASLLNI